MQKNCFQNGITLNLNWKRSPTPFHKNKILFLCFCEGVLGNNKLSGFVCNKANFLRPLIEHSCTRCKKKKKHKDAKVLNSKELRL